MTAEQSLLLTSDAHDHDPRHFTLQLDEDFCPKLLIFGEEPQEAAAGGSAEGDLQVMLATALPFLRAVVAILDSLSLLLENLLLQLGSLCAEHTRKATILQGMHP